jgi:hypothetical protein
VDAPQDRDLGLGDVVLANLVADITVKADLA